jgi:hypothetical protein
VIDVLLQSPRNQRAAERFCRVAMPPDMDVLLEALQAAAADGFKPWF